MTQSAVLFAAADLPPGEIRRAELPDGTPIAVYNVDGSYYATHDTCTHEEASLSEDGELFGNIVECGWHMGQFDVTTGTACQSPCNVDIRTYELFVEDGMLCVRT
ncbi:non-heme iron oxygenase ferredoxin subunit [Spectribacter hydrogenoxidans]|uniref:Non-heme iron oxygenase ferredoxin subunit n=1 Tax=Spectribacter hydrogenoxidans TaxID=3075608 RepID=A0ABU3C4B1_9GAMM|nr:non-heme iron oxygenase ferredoxin subunit [Salinisphaera sp. W335]MDT0636406.1 non-heme iron oxygenase ferredoxin subunit [Salinisphaera sp. W335]